MIPNFRDKGSPKPYVVSKDGIPHFGGRPKREKVIGREDLVDLEILLNTCDSVEEFLSKA
jgi:hypothetical protein